MSSDTARREFQEKVAVIQELRLTIPQLRADIAKAKRAKIDIGDQEKRLDELEAKYDAFLAEYG